MEVVKISYEEFLRIKACKYSAHSIRCAICRHLNITPEQIDDFGWNYGLYVNVWLKEG